MMTWSWVLAIIGLTGVFFIGRKVRWGWSVLLFNEFLWIVYGLYTVQWGFILSGLAKAFVCVKSYKYWKEKDVCSVCKSIERKP